MGGARPDPDTSKTRAGPRRFLRIRLRYWAIAIGAVVVVASFALAYEATLQPAPPFHQQWSRQFAGNLFADGAVVGNVFVTYEANVTVLSPRNATTSTAYSLEGVNLSDGRAVWSDSPLPPITPSVGAILPTMLGAGRYAVLAAEYIRYAVSGAALGLSLTSVDGASGRLMGSYNNTVAPSGPLDPASGMAITGSSLVMWFTTWINSTATTYDVVGLSFPGLQYRWNFSVTLPGGGGLTSTDSGAARFGGDAVMEVATGSNEGNATVFLINGTTGHLLLTHAIPSSAMGDSAVLGGSYYYLNQTGSSLWISSFNLTSGAAGAPIAVRNVADGSAQSAVLYGVASVLLVASYSPGLNYAAYSVAGAEVWQVAFPWASDCGPRNDFPAVGPCASDLNSPVTIPSGDVLLESFPSELSSGSFYTEQFDQVNATSGARVWSYSYTFAFGQKSWSWQSPEASYLVLASVGTSVLYTVVTPDMIAVACGTI